VNIYEQRNRPVKAMDIADALDRLSVTADEVACICGVMRDGPPVLIGSDGGVSFLGKSDTPSRALVITWPYMAIPRPRPSSHRRPSSSRPTGGD